MGIIIKVNKEADYNLNINVWISSFLNVLFLVCLFYELDSLHFAKYHFLIRISVYIYGIFYKLKSVKASRNIYADKYIEK